MGRGEGWRRSKGKRSLVLISGGTCTMFVAVWPFFFYKGISKNLAFDHLILNPSPKGEGQKEFLEMPIIHYSIVEVAPKYQDVVVKVLSPIFSDRCDESKRPFGRRDI